MAETHHGITFSTVLNAVDDLGMDNTGGTAIDSTLDNNYAADTLIKFPPGDYFVDVTHFFDADVSNFGLLGTGSTPEDVTFTLPEGDTKGSRHQTYNENNFGLDDNEHHLLWATSGSSHLLENFSIQQNDTTGTGITLSIADDIQVHDIHWLGFNPTVDHAQGTNLRPNIRQEDGTGVVSGVECLGGGVQDEYPARKVCVLSGQLHNGELLFDDFHVENLGSHPIYASNTNGCVRVENGLFKNNDNTNTRVAGSHPTKRSWVKNCDYVIDVDNAENLPSGESYQGCRGIRCDYGESVLLEDIDMKILSGPAAAYGIGFQHNLGATGAQTIEAKDIRIQCDVDGYLPFEGQPNDTPAVLDGVSITGSGDYRNDCGIFINERPMDVLNSCLELTGPTQDGILVDQENDVLIDSVNFSVTGQNIVTQSSSITTNNITEGDACTAPTIQSALPTTLTTDFSEY